MTLHLTGRFKLLNRRWRSGENEERKVEVFTAGCPLCDGTVKLVKGLSCPSCDVTVYDLNKEGMDKADTREVRK